MSESQVIWSCPDCGVEKVKENRGSYTKTYERYTDRDLFYANRNCTHSKVVCQRCGRPLTAHESVDRKMGPICTQNIELEAQILAAGRAN